LGIAETYEAFRSDICRRKTTRRLIAINNHPRCRILVDESDIQLTEKR
jgi:hypothetical protein